MARICSQYPSTSPAVLEAGQRFQLQPRTEKRTQGSTLFSTTAKNLISSVPFRWRPDQVKIFEDWVLFKGPNVMSADLLPLLRALDLDGYEDVKNSYGEFVHDLIIVKVRRKLMKTKKDMDMEVQQKTAYDTSQSTHVRTGDAAKVISPRANIPGHIRESGRDDNNVPTIKREQEDEQGDEAELLKKSSAAVPYHAAPGNYYQELPTARNTAPTPVRISQQSHYQNILPLGAPGKGKATTVPKYIAEHSLGTLRDGPGQPMQKPTSPYGLSPRTDAGRSTSKRGLLEGIRKLKDAMDGIHLIVDQLPDDTEAAALDTAAYDTTLEIEHLEDLIREYVES
ncbi:hypothetical protein F4803DRAFT_514179 [Xylaria telfairii]|nr:hypothetical protein F4803DRAFT_514179 [Xylaria telfairii]